MKRITPILFAASLHLLSIASVADASQGAERNGITPLMQAAYDGDIEKMRQLVDHGAAINQRNNLGLTALFFAAGGSHTQPAAKGSTEAVKFLLDHGAAVNFGSRINGITPLMAAADNENPDSVALLLKHGADINAAGSEGTALSMAIGRLDVKTVKVLLDHGAKVNGYVDTRGQTPLLEAIDASPAAPASLEELNRMSQKEKMASGMAMLIVHLLVDHGADLNVADHNGRTPLTLAIARKNVLMARVLIEAGANPNVADRQMGGASALILAVLNQQATIVNLLLKKTIDVNAKDRFGKTALDYAKALGPRGMVDLLYQAGAQE